MAPTKARRESSAPNTKARVQVTYRPIAQLQLDPKNPRRHSPPQVRQIAASIESFGFNVPVLVNNQSRVIAGHGRVMAARLLGLSEVPTIALEHLNDAQAKAFMIADNRLTDNSAWDERLLAEQLKELSVLDLDFSLETTGFTMGEIDLYIEGLSPAPDGDADPADALPDVSPGVVVARPGDLWLLGEHRVLVSSAIAKEAFAALMEGEKA
jgi:ParB-like chromosome segregation protein Spo0J